MLPTSIQKIQVAGSSRSIFPRTIRCWFTSRGSVSGRDSSTCLWTCLFETLVGQLKTKNYIWLNNKNKHKSLCLASSFKTARFLVSSHSLRQVFAHARRDVSMIFHGDRPLTKQLEDQNKEVNKCVCNLGKSAKYAVKHKFQSKMWRIVEVYTALIAERLTLFFFNLFTWKCNWWESNDFGWAVEMPCGFCFFV